MKQDINALALAARDNEMLRENLIRQHENMILRTASMATFRFVTKSDDEWSVALCAFSDAIDHYSPEKGNFLPFARVLIKRSLIDWHRSTAARNKEVSVSPFVLEGQCNEDAGEMEKAAYLAVVEQSLNQSQQSRREKSLQEEILAVNKELNCYGFRFFDLTQCSPKQERTRKECARAIRYVLSQPKLLEELEQSRKLSVGAIVEGSGVSRKLVDRYRKYLIMALVVLSGDYPQLAVYLKFVKKEVQG